ncbi:MAG: chromate transporter, partial [Oscillibacter sp.]|nr:chromate transporter [Oscillibacter sp.]
ILIINATKKLAQKAVVDKLTRVIFSAVGVLSVLLDVSPVVFVVVSAVLGILIKRKEGAK